MTAELVQRALTRAVLFALIGAAAAISPSEARQRDNHVQRSPAATAMVHTAVQGPQFFSIAAVLAKRDGLQQIGETARPSPQIHLATLSSTTPSSIAPRAADSPFTHFGFQPFASVNSSVAMKWRTVDADWGRDSARIEACRTSGAACRDQPARRFLAILGAVQSLNGEARLEMVNRRVNALIRYSSDFAAHGVTDIWSSPLASLGNSGDCEDYAIAKYYILQSAGLNPSDMRIVLLHDRRAGEDHAVLAVRSETGWRVLDNRWEGIQSDAELSHYRPVFALTGEQITMFASPYVGLSTTEERHVQPGTATSFDVQSSIDALCPEIARAI